MVTVSSPQHPVFIPAEVIKVVKLPYVARRIEHIYLIAHDTLNVYPVMTIHIDEDMVTVYEHRKELGGYLFPCIAIEVIVSDEVYLRDKLAYRSPARNTAAVSESAAVTVSISKNARIELRHAAYSEIAQRTVVYRI